MRIIKKILSDNQGSFTVEATFIFTISISVIMSLFYVLMFYTDLVFMESKVRRTINEQHVLTAYQGLMGSGMLNKQSSIDIFSSEYVLDYQIPRRFPLTEEYLGKDFSSFCVLVKDCDKDKGELIRFYEAIKARK